MNDETRVPGDLAKVSLEQAWEIEYWTKALGATEQELRDALQAVGPRVEQVQNYLERKDPPLG
jgi:hypothetical protein